MFTLDWIMIKTSTHWINLQATQRGPSGQPLWCTLCFLPVLKRSHEVDNILCLQSKIVNDSVHHIDVNLMKMYKNHDLNGVHCAFLSNSLSTLEFIQINIKLSYKSLHRSKRLFNRRRSVKACYLLTGDAWWRPLIKVQRDSCPPSCVEVIEAEWPHWMAFDNGIIADQTWAAAARRHAR